MRCDLDRLADIVGEAQILLTQDYKDNMVGLCLYPCNKTGIMHAFEEDRRCIRCDAQLCVVGTVRIFSSSTLF